MPHYKKVQTDALALKHFPLRLVERKVKHTVERRESIDILLRNVLADLTFFLFITVCLAITLSPMKNDLRFH